MARNIIGIVGSYRRSGIIDQAVDAALRSALEGGARVEKVYLLDKNIEFCTNCRSCTQGHPDEIRGKCVFNDDMSALLSKIDEADGFVFGSPINFGTVTALTKRFIERLIVYTYWPWGQLAPKARQKRPCKKAVVVTSSSCPVYIGKILMPGALQILKEAAATAGARAVKTVYIGGAGLGPKESLSERQLKSAKKAGEFLL